MLGPDGREARPVEEEDMRRRMVVWTVAVALAALAGVARASHEQDLGRSELQAQVEQNRALARFIKYNGMPDVAIVRPISDEPPWDDHEVTLYYFEQHKEVSFARARILGSPQVHLLRYQRTLSNADISALRTHQMIAGEQVASATTTTPTAVTETTCSGSASQRAECAAARAENAADRIDAAAVKAESAADRTEAVVAKMAARTVHKKTKTN
jgi:hypothetical protein